jgi:polyisoprenyl-phosphate glycosyltransferase
VSRAPEFSVVAPVYNERDSIREFHRQVVAALATHDFELVLVDDGSTDGTSAVLAELASKHPRTRPVFLSRNFGHQAALTAGIDHARGGAVVTLDGDLQDPPDVIPRLIERWRLGADVVHAVRYVRPDEPAWRLALIRGFYRLFGRVSGLPTFPSNSGDFRLIAGGALAALRQLPERTRFLRGLVSWVGFQQDTIVYERAGRFAGETKYPLRKLLRLAGDAIVSFSALPLQMASYLGLAFSALSLLAIPVIILLRLTGIYQVPGTASIHILVLFIGGVQLIFLGVFGEYLARVYDETKHRPTYLVAPGPAPAAPEYRERRVPEGDRVGNG